MIVACPTLAFAFMLLLIFSCNHHRFCLYIIILFLSFLALSFLHAFKMFFTLVSLVFQTHAVVFHARAPPFCFSRSREITRAHNNEKMAFVYTEGGNLDVTLLLRILNVGVSLNISLFYNLFYIIFNVLFVTVCARCKYGLF